MSDFLAFISFDEFKDAFYFVSGICTSLIGVLISYSRWVSQRSQKRFAAEYEFNELRKCYEALQSQQGEANRTLRQFEGELREMKGMLKIKLREDGNDQDF